MGDTLIFDSALRLLRDHTDAPLFAAVERGEWPETLWKALVGAGFHDFLTDGLVQNSADALQVFRAQGQSAAPVPLLEAMIAATLGHASNAQQPMLAALPRRTDDVNSVMVRWPGAARALACTRRGVSTISAPSSGSMNPVQTHATRNYAGEPQAMVDTRNLHWQPFPASPDFETVWLFCALARAALIRGAVEHMLVLTVEYANTRVQFGKPLGKQQAVQHQLALMAEEVAAAGVAVDYAAHVFAQGNAAQRWQAVAAAKIRAGEAAGSTAEIAHQIHGAIGFTQEYELQRYSRRVWTWRDEFGNESEWAYLLGRQLTQTSAPPLWRAITQTVTRTLDT